MLCQPLTEKQHYLASLTHKYFTVGGGNPHWKWKWSAMLDPHNSLSGNWHGITHGSVLATPVCSSTRQFNWIFQNGFAVSRISLKMQYNPFFDMQPPLLGGWLENTQIRSSVSSHKEVVFANMVGSYSSWDILNTAALTWIYLCLNCFLKS